MTYHLTPFLAEHDIDTAIQPFRLPDIQVSQQMRIPVAVGFGLSKQTGSHGEFA